jgi:hypothetical protein
MSAFANFGTEPMPKFLCGVPFFDLLQNGKIQAVNFVGGYFPGRSSSSGTRE